MGIISPETTVSAYDDFEEPKGTVKRLRNELRRDADESNADPMTSIEAIRFFQRRSELLNAKHTAGLRIGDSRKDCFVVTSKPLFVLQPAFRITAALPPPVRHRIDRDRADDDRTLDKPLIER